MTTFLNWAARHPIATLGAIILYSIAMIAAHDHVQSLAYWCYQKFGRSTLNLAVTVGSCCALAAIAWRLFSSFRTTGNRAAKALYCIGTLVLLAVSYNALFYTNVEAIHFAQYALPAIPIFALTRRFRETIFYTALIGVIDECYQYFFIYQARFRSHLDFNDMVLNLLGAAVACVLIMLLVDPQRFPPAERRSPRGTGFKQLARSPLLIITLLLVLVCCTLFATGLMRVDAVAGEPRPPLLLSIDGPHQAFWKHTPWDKRYHDLRPAEGLLLLIALFCLYLPLDRLWRGPRPR